MPGKFGRCRLVGETDAEDCLSVKNLSWLVSYSAEQMASCNLVIVGPIVHDLRGVVSPAKVRTKFVRSWGQSFGAASTAQKQT